jgi:oligopeptide transport system substrate-binding protein
MIRYRSFALFAALAVIAAACGPIPTSAPLTPSAPATRAPQAASATPTSTPAPTKTPPPPVKVLRIGLSTYPDVLDPQRASSNSELQVLKLVYAGLLSVDEKGNIQPGAADKWELSKDGTAMTFHIRDGLKRFDGTPITARDYEYALKRAVDPRIFDKPNTVLLYDVKGAQELDNMDPAKTKSEDMDKALANLDVKATDDKTLVVTFKKPNGHWQYIASTVVTFPIERKQVDRDPDNWWLRPDGHNSNGPFAIRSLEQGKKIVLVPNPKYWRGKPALDRIELVFYPNGKALLDAYKKGDVDIDANIAPEELATITADATLTNELLHFPAAITYAIGFNSARKPFDDRNVRAAFSQAFDREGWAREVLKGVGKPYTRWIPPGVPGAQPDRPGVPGYDPKVGSLTLVNNSYTAKDSTTDNPKVDCAKLGEIKLTFAASPLNQARFQFLADNWTRVFGCPIKLDPIDAAALRALSKDDKTRPQISFQGYWQDYPHPQNWLGMYWTCGGNDFSVRYGYCNKELDALLLKADQERDWPKSLLLYQQAEDLMLKDVPAAFANYLENIYLVKPYVMGPKDHTGSNDTAWPGEWGPVWAYDIDLSQVPANYPK